MRYLLFFPFPSPHHKIHFAIHTDDENIARALRINYGDALIVEETVSADHVISIDRDGGSYRVTLDQQSTVTGEPLYELERILFEYTNYDQNILALHGAAVEWQGAAYLFLAATTGGKTTLTSYLTHHGFGYLTDDCILLNRHTSVIHPDGKPIHLRSGGLSVLQNCGAAPAAWQIFQTPQGERYVFLPETVCASPVPLTGIFFLNRTENANAITRLGANDALRELLHSPITPYPPQGEYLRLLLRIAARGCYMLTYCDMEWVRRQITEGTFRG